MMAVSAWIKTGTTVISDYWAAYRFLKAHGYTHRTVKHSIAFIDERPEVNEHDRKHVTAS
jgi:hypothetical protein